VLGHSSPVYDESQVQPSAAGRQGLVKWTCGLRKRRPPVAGPSRSPSDLMSIGDSLPACAWSHADRRSWRWNVWAQSQQVCHFKRAGRLQC
jgi:hypothetical protein